MFEENNDLILIKAIYYSKSCIIGEQIFTPEVTFGDILNYFNANLKTEFLNLKRIYSYNGINLSETYKMKEMFKMPKDKSCLIEIKIEVNEEAILDDEFDPVISKIIKPKFYPFSLFVYSPREGKITLEEYTSNISKEYNLKKISSGSSYCNSPDSLFISGGGVYYKNPINDFWIINKEDYSIELKKMPLAKRDHSMIYIPNQLVLIVGGGDNKCIIYDIQKDIFFDWADLNDKHYKPALFILNNYIYCFGELTKEKNYFERTNISSKYPKWEKIFPIFKRNVYLFNKKIFFVSKSINNLIIFGAGDNKRQSKIYMYNLLNNEISILEDTCDIEELDNKTFEKVSESYNIAIPKYYDRERNILILNKKKKKINKIYFSNNKLDKIRIFEKDEIMSDESDINIEIKPIKNNQINSSILESKLNSIKKNIEDVNMSYKKKHYNINTECFDQNNTVNLIEEINEDDEEKYENNNMNNKTISINSNHIKYNIPKNIGYSEFVNTRNQNNDYYNNEINKDFNLGENDEFFKNKIENENKEEDEIQLSGIIKKGDEFDSIDRYAISERSLLSQIESGKKDMFSSGKKNSTNKKINKLPQVKQNLVQKTFVLNNINHKVENDKDANVRNNRYYSLNNMDNNY